MKKTEKKVEVEKPVEVTNYSSLAQLIEIYKKQSPKKYEAKKLELEAKLKANK